MRMPKPIWMTISGMANRPVNSARIGDSTAATAMSTRVPTADVVTPPRLTTRWTLRHIRRPSWSGRAPVGARHVALRQTGDVLIVVGPVEAEAHSRRTHPERPARIEAVMDGVGDLHLGHDLVVLPSQAADLDQLGTGTHRRLPRRPPPVLCGRRRASGRRHLRHPGIVGHGLHGRRGGAGGHRRAERARRRGGLRGRPPSRPSRAGRPVDGLLSDQQRRRGRRSLWSVPVNGC